MSVTMRRTATSAVTLTLILCLDSAYAQNWTVNSWSVPEAAPEAEPLEGGVTRVARGDFNGDRMPDVAAVVGGRLAFFSAPDEHVSFALPDPDRQVTDLATLPGAGPEGLDAIVSIGADGIVLWALDPQDPDEQIHPTTLAGGAFAGGRVLRVGPLAGGGPEIVAVAADGVSVSRVWWNGSAWMQAPLLTASADVLDLELLDWGPAAWLDVAVLTATTFDVYAGATGAPDVAASASGAFDCLDVVRHRGRARDQVAIASHASAQGTRTLTVRGDGFVEAGLDLGLVAVFDVDAADTDGDGDSELCVAHGDGPDQLVLYSVSTTTPSSKSYALAQPGVDHATFAAAAPGAPFHLDSPSPVFGDFDKDGDVDVFLASKSTGKVLIARSVRIDENARRIQLAAEAGCQLFVYDASSESRLDIPVAKPAVLLGGATHVEVITWVRDTASGWLLPRPAQHMIFPVTSDWAAVPLTVTITVPGEFDPVEGDALYLQVRPIVVTGGGTAYGAVGPSTTLLVTPLDDEFAAMTGGVDALYGTAVGAPDQLFLGNTTAPYDPSLDPDPVIAEGETASALPEFPDPDVSLASGGGGGAQMASTSTTMSGGVAQATCIGVFSGPKGPVPPRRPPVQ